MKIKLIDVDGKIPNLALMKVSSFHKAWGDDVELEKLNYIGDIPDTRRTRVSANCALSLRAK